MSVKLNLANLGFDFRDPHVYFDNSFGRVLRLPEDIKTGEELRKAVIERIREINNVLRMQFSARLTPWYTGPAPNFSFDRGGPLAYEGGAFTHVDNFFDFASGKGGYDERYEWPLIDILPPGYYRFVLPGSPEVAVKEGEDRFLLHHDNNVIGIGHPCIALKPDVKLKEKGEPEIRLVLKWEGGHCDGADIEAFPDSSYRGLVGFAGYFMLGDEEVQAATARILDRVKRLHLPFEVKREKTTAEELGLKQEEMDAFEADYEAFMHKWSEKGISLNVCSARGAHYPSRDPSKPEYVRQLIEMRGIVFDKFFKSCL